ASSHLPKQNHGRGDQSARRSRFVRHALWPRRLHHTRHLQLTTIPLVQTLATTNSTRQKTRRRLHGLHREERRRRVAETDLCKPGERWSRESDHACSHGPRLLESEDAGNEEDRSSD